MHLLLSQAGKSVPDGIRTINQPHLEDVWMVQLLKEAGPRGSTLEELVTGVQDAGLKTWTDMRIAKSSIASTCGHDLAFGRLPHGRFALRGLPGVRQVLGPQAAAA